MSNLEEYKQQKSLQEQRRTGKAKVEKDNIDEINPYMPVFIAKAPWYMKTDDESLDHQKSTLKPQDDPDTWYQRGQRAGPAATKYRKGACANCGAITHKARDCLERPRKVGAKWTGKDIQQDEVIQQISLGFEGKRDRWNGYDSREQLKTVKDWELVEEKRRQIREKLAQEKLERAAKAAADGDVDFKQSDSDSDDKSDEGKYAEEAEMVGQVVGSFNKTKMTLRNLRLREDTAKYLRNLDVNSAHYDPKTRSMQENPYEKSDPNNVDFVGDGFLRNTGDVQDHTELQSFAWEVEKRGTQLHLNANPTEMALLNKKLAQERKDTVNVKKTSILARYGGQEHLDSIPKELLLAQTENYVEYSQQGQIIKGQEKATAKSKYLEDVYIFNHTTVWGSYWEDGKWGYRCCRSFTKNAYCVGAQSIEALESAQDVMIPVAEANEQTEKPKSLLDQYIENASRLKKVDAQDETKLDKDRLDKAISDEKKRQRDGEQGTRDKLSEEDLEAYRLVRMRPDDPMAEYMS